MMYELTHCQGCGLFIAARAYDFHIMRCGETTMHDPDTRDKRANIIARYLAREITKEAAVVLLVNTGMRESEAREVLS